MNKQMAETFYPLTLKCTNPECMLRVRLGRINDKPCQIVGMLDHCPGCGNKSAVTAIDDEEDYWEIMATHYKLPIDLVKDLFNIWDRRKYIKFGDFVRKMKEDARK